MSAQEQSWINTIMTQATCHTVTETVQTTVYNDQS